MVRPGDLAHTSALAATYLPPGRVLRLRPVDRKSPSRLGDWRGVTGDPRSGRTYWPEEHKLLVEPAKAAVVRKIIELCGRH